MPLPSDPPHRMREGGGGGHHATDATPTLQRGGRKAAASELAHGPAPATPASAPAPAAATSNPTAYARGWQEVVDKASGHTYYLHADGTSQWEKPAGFKQA